MRCHWNVYPHCGKQQGLEGNWGNYEGNCVDYNLLNRDIVIEMKDTRIKSMIEIEKTNSAHVSLPPKICIFGLGTALFLLQPSSWITLFIDIIVFFLMCVILLLMPLMGISIVILTYLFTIPPELPLLAEDISKFTFSFVTTGIQSFFTNIETSIRTGSPLPLLWAYIIALLFGITAAPIIVMTRKVKSSPRIRQSDLWHINPKILLFLIFALVITCNTTIVSTRAEIADRYALSENRNLEEGTGYFALDELLTGFDPRGIEYQVEGFTPTRKLLESLYEANQLTLLNESVRQGLLDWIEAERDPIMTQVETEDFTTNVSSYEVSVHNWWGTLERSLEAARILKILGNLTDDISTDIQGQIMESFGGSEPAWSIRHPDFPTTYQAFVTAYEYELFDMFEVYGLPKLDMKAYEIANEYSLQNIYPYEWGEVVSETTTNLTFHAGYEDTFDITSNESLSVQLPTLVDWFKCDISQPVPYQTISVEWLPSNIPNQEDLTKSLAIGLVEEHYVDLEEDDPVVVKELNDTYGLELVEDDSPEQNSTIYRYYVWNYEVLWYEMAVQLWDSTSNTLIDECLMDPTQGVLSIELDLIDTPSVSVIPFVRQALHTFSFEWDNEPIVVPLEGWKNESFIKFEVEEYEFILNPEEELLTRLDGTQEWSAKADTVVIIESAEKELHTFRYDDPFPNYAYIPFEVVSYSPSVMYGVVDKSTMEGEMFLEINHEVTQDGGGVYTWNTQKTDPLSLQYEQGTFKYGSISDTIGYTHQHDLGQYHVLIYPITTDYSTTRLNSKKVETIPVTVRYQEVLENSNPLDDYAQYYPFLNQSQTEFYVTTNATEIDQMWTDVTMYTSMLNRLAEVAMPYILNIFPILDTIYAYQNTSSFLFQDKLSTTIETWDALDEMGYFHSLVSDEELGAVFQTMMDHHYHEEITSYHSQARGETSFLVAKVGFSDGRGGESWDVDGTLAALRLLKMLRARQIDVSGGGGSSVEGELLKNALSPTTYPLTLEPVDLPSHGVMWSAYMANQDLSTSYDGLVYQVTKNLETELEMQYELTYEEIYQVPRITLSKESLLVPTEAMYWDASDTKDRDRLLDGSPIILLGLLLIGVFTSTGLGGTTRHRWWGGIMGFLILLQSYAVALTGSGSIPSLEEQLATVSKMTHYFMNQIYAFSQEIKIAGKEPPFLPFTRPSETVGNTIVPFSTCVECPEPFEDRSLEQGYRTYLADYFRQRHRERDLVFSTAGITVPADRVWVDPLMYEGYVEGQFLEVADQKIGLEVGEIYGEASEVLEQAKLLPGVGDVSTKSLLLKVANFILPDFHAIINLKAKWTILKNLDTYKRYPNILNDYSKAIIDGDTARVNELAGDLDTLMSIPKFEELIQEITLQAQLKNVTKQVASVMEQGLKGVLTDEEGAVLDKVLKTAKSDKPHTMAVMLGYDVITRIAERIDGIDLPSESRPHTMVLDEIITQKGLDKNMLYLSVDQSDTKDRTVSMILVTDRPATEVANMLGESGGILTLMDYNQRKSFFEFIFEQKGIILDEGKVDDAFDALLGNDELPVLVISANNKEVIRVDDLTKTLLKEARIKASLGVTGYTAGGTRSMMWRSRYRFDSDATGELARTRNQFRRTIETLDEMVRLSTTPIQGVYSQGGKMRDSLGRLLNEIEPGKQIQNGKQKQRDYMRNIWGFDTGRGKTVPIGKELLLTLCDIAEIRLSEGDPIPFMYCQDLISALGYKIQSYYDSLTKKNEMGEISFEEYDQALWKETPTPLHEDYQSAIAGTAINVVAYLASNPKLSEIELLNKAIGMFYGAAVRGNKERKFLIKSPGETPLSLPKNTIGRNYYVWLYRIMALSFGEDIAYKTFSAKVKEPYESRGYPYKFNGGVVPLEAFESFRVFYGTASSNEGVDMVFVKQHTDSNGDPVVGEIDFSLCERKTGKFKKSVTPGSKSLPERYIQEIQIPINSLISAYFGIPVDSSGNPYMESSGRTQLLNELILLKNIGKAHLCHGIISTTSKEGRSGGFIIEFGGKSGGKRITTSTVPPQTFTMWVGDEAYTHHMMEAVQTAMQKSIMDSTNSKFSEFNAQDYKKLREAQNDYELLQEYYNTLLRPDLFSKPYSRLWGVASEPELHHQPRLMFLQLFFSAYFNDHLTTFKEDNSSVKYQIKIAFWKEFINELRKFTLNMSPSRPSMETNFLLNGIPTDFLSLQDKLAAMTSAYYTTYCSYEYPNILGEGYVQGKVADATVTLLNVPDVTDEASLTLDWGDYLPTVNMYLDRDYPADYLIVDMVQQEWVPGTGGDPPTITLTDSLQGLSTESVVGVEQYMTEYDKVIIPATALINLVGSTISLEAYPVVEWMWRDWVEDGDAESWYVNGLPTESWRNSDWNQGEVVFKVQNEQGEQRTIGVMATMTKAGMRGNLVWVTTPDVKLFVDPITWLTQVGDIGTTGEVETIYEWDSPFVPEQIDLYELARDAFYEAGKSTENLQLVGIILGSGESPNYVERTLFGSFQFRSKSEDDTTFTYHQTAVKTFYQTYTESDDEISLADEDIYTQYADELATGIIDGSTEMLGENNAQKWYVVARAQDIYDNFAEFIGHGIALVKDSNGDYIGAFHSSYPFPDHTETLNAPRWTTIPEEQTLPIYVYYDFERTNGWDQELWYFTALTLVNELNGESQAAVMATADELYDVMVQPNVRAIVIMLGAIPSNLWGYIDPAEGNDTTNSQAKTMVEDHSILELFIGNGGTVISAGPYGGLRGVSYITNDYESVVADYRNVSDLPLLNEGYTVDVVANPAEVLNSSDTNLISSESDRFMSGSPDISGYYSTGLNLSTFSETNRILQVYASDGNYKDVALKVGNGIFVNYHTAGDNTGKGSLNWGNGQGFIDDLVTIITGLPQTETIPVFVPTNDWTPSSAGMTDLVYEVEDFEDGVGGWSGLTTTVYNGDKVGAFGSSVNDVYATSGTFSDLSGVNVSEYPLLAVDMNTYLNWAGVYTTMRDKGVDPPNFTFDSGESYATSSSDNIEGSDAIKFTYSLPTDPDTTSTLHYSSYEYTSIFITDDTSWTFALRPDACNGDDLIGMDKGDDTWDHDFLTKPDVWAIRLRISDGTGLEKYLWYYYSFKTLQNYGGEVIADMPTDFTQFYDGSNWVTICNYSDGKENGGNGESDDSYRYIALPVENEVWNRCSTNVLSDFNTMFSTAETEVEITRIDFRYTATTFTNTDHNNTNAFYLDDFIFVEASTDEDYDYWLQQDYTDGVNIYRVYSGLSDDGVLTISGEDRESGDWWRGDSGYDYAIVIVDSVGQDVPDFSQESDWKAWTTLTCDGSDAISTIPAVPCGNSLYYMGKPTIHREFTGGTNPVYINNLVLSGFNDTMTVDSTSKYRGNVNGVSLHASGDASHPNVKVSKTLNETTYVKNYNYLSFDLRIASEGSDQNTPIRVGFNGTVDAQSDDYWYILETVDGWMPYSLDLFWFVEDTDEEPIDYLGTINSLIFGVGDGEVWIDHVVLSGAKGTIILDDLEYATDHSNYSNYTLASSYFTDHWTATGSPPTFEITADTYDLASSVTIIDGTKINALLTGVEGTGTFTLTMKVFKEDGSTLVCLILDRSRCLDGEPSMSSYLTLLSSRRNGSSPSPRLAETAP